MEEKGAEGRNQPKIKEEMQRLSMGETSRKGNEAGRIEMSLHMTLLDATLGAPERPGYFYIHTNDDCTEKYIGATTDLKDYFKRLDRGQKENVSNIVKKVHENKTNVRVIYSLQETTDGAYEKKNRLLDIFRSKHSGEFPAWQKKEPNQKIRSSPHPATKSQENITKGSSNK